MPAFENNERKRIIQRVQKLLALAEANTVPEESATAAAMAEKIMRKYQLERADVLVKNMGKSDVGKESVNHGQARWGGSYSSKQVPLWVGPLAIGCARINDCECNQDRRGNIIFYGAGGDQEVAAEMFKYLLQEVDRLTQAYNAPKAASQQFRHGCAARINGRLKELHAERMREFAAASSGTQLVELKNQLITEEYGAFKYGRFHREADRDYMNGVAAGNRVNLDKQIGAVNGSN